MHPCAAMPTDVQRSGVQNILLLGTIELVKPLSSRRSVSCSFLAFDLLSFFFHHGYRSHVRSIKFSSYFAKHALALHFYWLSVGGYTPIYQFIVPFCTPWPLLSVIRSRLKNLSSPLYQPLPKIKTENCVQNSPRLLFISGSIHQE